MFIANCGCIVNQFSINCGDWLSTCTWWDTDLWLMDCSQAGAFTVASEDVLHHRTILKAKRRCIVSHWLIYLICIWFLLFDSWALLSVSSGIYYMVAALSVSYYWRHKHYLRCVNGYIKCDCLFGFLVEMLIPRIGKSWFGIGISGTCSSPVQG